MHPFEIGAVLPLAQFGPERTTARWADIRRMAELAEAMGFDTLWTPDELLWLTQVDLMLGPGTVEAFEALAPVLELVRAD